MAGRGRRGGKEGWCERQRLLSWIMEPPLLVVPKLPYVLKLSLAKDFQEMRIEENRSKGDN